MKKRQWGREYVDCREEGAVKFFAETFIYASIRTVMYKSSFICIIKYIIVYVIVPEEQTFIYLH